MKKAWWALPIIVILMAVGAFSAQAVFASHMPIPEVVSNYPETREDVKAWVFHLKYKGESHFIYPTNPLGMGGPTDYAFVVDDWSDWGHDPLPHWVFWWKDWTGKVHYFDVGQVERRATGPGGTTEGVRWESALAAKIELDDGQVAFDCYARAIPQNFRVWDGSVNPWTTEHTNKHVNKAYCVFALPAAPTPTPTPTPQPQVAACSDGADNDGDGWRDADDRGCHWDNNSENPASYNPQDNDEWNDDSECCTAPPPQAGCVATQESWSPRYGTDWYPGRPGTGLVEVHVWWPDYTQERKILLTPSERVGFKNGGGSAWSWPFGCDDAARNSFQNQTTWLPQVSLSQLRSEGRIR